MIAELEALRKQDLRDRLHRRRQPDRQQEGDQAGAPRRHRLAGRAHGYPFTFFTEASLDLADDAELMELMVEANIIAVFIGIESPNEESLRETKKYPERPRRAGRSSRRSAESRTPGIEVWCGMIVGFDNDDARIFDAQLEFLRETDIMHAMVGMLSAIPKTPLLRPSDGRGPARSRRRAGVRHQRHSARHDSRRVARRATSA